MRRFFYALIVTTCLSFAPVTQAKATKPLEIYFIDVEGGQATLVVDPRGPSLLVDTGWAGFDGRDARRIVAAARAAGLKQIDYVLITHYHSDHVGGVPQLAQQIKIGTFVDHGPNMEDSDTSRKLYADYEKVIGQSKHLVLKPGDRLPFKGITVQALTAAGEHIATPLPGANQPNPVCASEAEADVADTSENARSLGILITYGKFRFIDLGDLTKRKERELACPNNLIGTVDLYLSTHHGLYQSNAKVIVEALHPRVAIMNNGPHKGGSKEAWGIIHNSPGLEDLWQLHYAVDSDKEHNVPEMLIANPAEKCEGKYIKVTANPDGAFTVLNSRNDYHKTYTKEIRASSRFLHF
ncbi:MAG TPA: MBL fold metallo-hydrolase [Candidatus Angelobacter sp.]|jgi:beta-lactamase superfamily II metal-dependent hydrolase|nr:MBL fold metallo-hydrolase [Candidatus Angelobacter sp.]